MNSKPHRGTDLEISHSAYVHTFSAYHCSECFFGAASSTLASAPSTNGGSEIRRQKPFKIARKGRAWIVEGSTPADRGVPYFGGNFTIHIDSVSGAITHLSHSK